MATEMQPNQWYKVGDLLDPNTQKYHRVRTFLYEEEPPAKVPLKRDFLLTEEQLQKFMDTIRGNYADEISRMEEERKRIEREREGMPASLNSLFSARFHGSQLQLGFRDAKTSPLDVKVDEFGRVIHYPLGRPGNGAYEDHNGELKFVAGYTRLIFDIQNPRLEDATNEEFSYESFDEVHVMARPYNFRMLLKSKNGVWVSDPPLKLNIATVYKAVEVGGELIVDNEPSPYNEVSFGLWTPENGGVAGPSYVPENGKDQISQLEIMIQEKQVRK